MQTTAGRLAGSAWLMIGVSFVITMLIAASLLTGRTAPPAANDRPRADRPAQAAAIGGAAIRPAARIAEPALGESSGLARARSGELFFSHNDSGGGAVLYAVGLDGAARGRVDVDGAVARDWEDITSDGAGHLWIADTGNNDNDRRDLAVLRVPEPGLPISPGARIAVDRTVRVRYPDQAEFPPPPGERFFDSEALFWADGSLFLLTKHRGDTRTRLFRVPALDDGADVLLDPLGEFDVGADRRRKKGMVTAADVSADGQHLAVLAYHALFVFARPEDSRSWLSRPVARIELDQDVAKQCESVVWLDDVLWFGNEEGELHRVVRPLDPGCTAWPSVGCG